MPRPRREESVATAQESKMHRLRVGDRVSWEDGSEFPPVQYEGEVTGFDNEELTYLKVNLAPVADSSATAEERVLTEDEVKRIG